MKVFNPRVRCMVYSASGHNVYGESVLAPSRQELCDVLNLTLRNQQTPIGSSYSESNGRSEEQAADLHILMHHASGVRMGDVIELQGTRFVVKATRTRFDWRGRIDHIEVQGGIE